MLLPKMDLEPIWEEIKMNNELSNEMDNLNMNNDEKSCCGSRYACLLYTSDAADD
jgi:hypothetical protein